MSDADEQARRRALTRSWDRNAERWIRAVREGRIASRRGATDDAIVAAVLRQRPRRLLDAGCGEGWLPRRLRAEIRCVTLGIDGAAALVAAARQADPEGDYRLLRYESLGRLADEIGSGFDVVVFNFALFDRVLAATLADAATLLNRDGVILIQTLHPGAATGGSEDGWRCENFSGFAEAGWQPMPWYGHSVASWQAAIADAGLVLLASDETRAEDGTALSLLMTCGREGKAC